MGKLHQLKVTSYLPFSMLETFGPLYLLSLSVPDGTSGKEPPANAGDIRDSGSIPGSGGSPGGGHGSPLQYSCLENPMSRGAWRSTVHAVAKSQRQLEVTEHTPIIF